MTDSKHTLSAKSIATPEALLAEAIAHGDDFALVTGHHARQFNADLAELRELRARSAGGSVYRRKGSSVWQLKYRRGDRWVQESSGTRHKAEARRLLEHKVYLASAGQLPGTATFEQTIGLLLNDARVRGLKSVSRMARAGRALLARLEGLRAKDVGHSALLKYAAQRQAQGCAADTVKLELDVARRALKLALRTGWLTTLPEFPRIRNLHVRSGFFEPQQWADVRKHLTADFRDAADFAYRTGWRLREVLGLKWANVDRAAKLVRLDVGTTKSGAGRVFPFGPYPPLAELLKRRAAVAERLRVGAVIAPWVFCFAEPLAYHAAGDPLFDRGGGDLLGALRRQFRAACERAGYPGHTLHDLRRSAARNFERSRIPRSVARKLGGWSDKIYSRYAIGAESEVEGAVSAIADYMARAEAGDRRGDTRWKKVGR